MSTPGPHNWEAPDHLPISSRKFLEERSERINNIVALAYFQSGQILLQVERKFKADPERDNWFPRWVTECTPFSYTKARSLIAIVTKAEKDPRIKELAEKFPMTTMHEVIGLPEKVRKEFLDLMAEGHDVRQKDIHEVRDTPEFDVAKLEEMVMQLQTTLFSMSTAPVPTDARQRSKAKAGIKKQEEKLQAYLVKLSEAKAKLEKQDKILSMQDVVLNQLHKQLRERELQLEEISLDPAAKRNREMAKTIVDATRGLDLLLSALDKYDTDKPDLGPEAVAAIERKMELVKQKLLKQYAPP